MRPPWLFFVQTTRAAYNTTRSMKNKPQIMLYYFNSMHVNQFPRLINQSYLKYI